MRKTIYSVLIFVAAILTVFLSLSIKIVDDRDYSTDGYSVYFLGEKEGYLYFDGGVYFENLD